MYEFHYKYIERKVSADLLFTDTDSLVYEIKIDDVYEDLYRDKGLFDFSDYLRDSMFLDLAYKKLICKMKDEFKAKIKSKMCSLVHADGEGKKK